MKLPKNTKYTTTKYQTLFKFLKKGKGCAKELTYHLIFNKKLLIDIRANQ